MDDEKRGSTVEVEIGPMGALFLVIVAFCIFSAILWLGGVQ